MKANAVDLDFLGAVLHARRSRLAEGERLDSLCRLQGWPELVRVIYPEAELISVRDFQRRLVRDLVDEASSYLNYIGGAAKDLVAWMLSRFQVENAKVLVRVLVNKLPIEEAMRLIIPLPEDLPLDMESVQKGSPIEDWIARLPFGVPRQWMRKAAPLFETQPRSFFLESVLDYGYSQGLLTRVGGLPMEERDLVQPVVLQEINICQLMLILRGKFHYGMAIEQLLALLIRGTGVSAARLATMFKEPDALTAAARVIGRILDEVPPSGGTIPQPGPSNLSALESLAWQRFLRLANRSFRRSHMGIGAIVGYLAIRRVEVANLIRISEALRLGLAPDATSPWLIRRPVMRSAYV